MLLGNQRFGFGCMRLPMLNGQIDTAIFCEMVDLFLQNGFTYFDTAHGYIGEKSEIAVRDCLTSRYPRDAYQLTNKLSTSYFDKQEDIRPLFQSQLDACGVTYFDCYLMHAQSSAIYEKFKRCRAYETALELQAEGKIKHFGISFHDKAAVLDRILTDYPQIELVQIQLNYIDYDDPAIEGGKCYDVCRKHHKEIIVMEPCKGGNLVQLPTDAKQIFDALGTSSPASYALRYAASFDGVVMVLSGMSTLAQVQENVQVMNHTAALSDAERTAIAQVCDVFRAKNFIACTACRYCIDQCPEEILIPDLFACLNAKNVFGDWNSDYYYHQVHTIGHGKASMCIHCGRCEAICPQHLPIRLLLQDVSAVFDKK